MVDKLTKCLACNGRGYFRCDCWPADCICGQDEDTCWECEGDGWLDPSYDDFDTTPSPQPSVRVADTQIERLMDAVEGECDGLAIDADQARAILAHVMTGGVPIDDPVTVADYAARLFDLHGFMLLHSAGSDGKPTITISFPDLKEAQQFHNTLVELSQHTPSPQPREVG